MPEDRGRAASEAGVWPLPRHAHVPGRNARPDPAFMEILEASVPADTMAAGPENPAWWYGLRLIREGFAFEAHEILEIVWMRARPNSRERALLQAMIHVANLRLKVMAGQARAASRIHSLASGMLDEAFAPPAVLVLGMQEIEARTLLGPSEV